MSAVSLAQKAPTVRSDDGHPWYDTHDYSAHSNDRSVADLSSRCDADVHADPHVASNMHGFQSTFRVEGKSGALELMIVCVEHEVAANLCVVADRKAPFSPDECTGTDVYVGPNGNTLSTGDSHADAQPRAGPNRREGRQHDSLSPLNEDPGNCSA